MTTSLKNDVINVLDQLPQERLAEVLDFALFVRARVLEPVEQRVVADHVASETIVDHITDGIEGTNPFYYGRH